ncbi:ABC transport system ATP-binding/permease protein [Synechococcus sp. RS9909]|uniref:ABC-F family ATP-binding cassette domain-containing protein n=1 Tax=unclassified Synechococcus TaxID=2626047 RepID=UPI000068F9B2|nr:MULTISPECIES: ABC-F family ATP-binding cassette domain-containing protein [unclassified Synechococcus]EAQ68371.1 putative ABC transporter, ATP binding protein [Synechococcus sp. RS9917]QNI80367.1 ABC transport system ATP-binding/permease protein [Synechococcus sp. RS9909]
MSLISLVGAAKDFGIRTLFADLTLHIGDRDRLGLIGPNGAGKSTLLKVLAGVEPLGSGERRCSPRLRIELVGQESAVQPGLTVLEQVLAGCGEKRDLLLRFNALSEAVAANPNDGTLLSALGQLSERMDEAEAWGLEQQCQEVLQRLGISDLQRPVEALSGGYRKRVSLASALVACPDVLLLDEPTNHLDAAAVEWLQSWLDRYPGAVVLVTHDRYVLDRVTNRMVEVERGEARSYAGNYSTYLQRKAEQDAADAASAASFKSVLRRELAWLRQGPKARSTKQKARLQRIEAMREAPTRQARKQLEMTSVSRRIGKIAIEAEQIRVTADGTPDGTVLLEDFTYSFSPEDRIGIIGPNGSGKSTLLDLIAGRRQPSSGQLRLGDTVHLGYLDQHTEALSSGKGLERKVIDFVEEAASRIDLGSEQLSASQLLERFLFPPAQQHSPLSKLSGGERRRLTLCRLLIQAPNVLLLDEPTNDLDVQTLSVLEDLLDDFRGCVVVVSHDRYFLDRTVDRLFCFEQGRLERFDGNYSAFMDQRREQERLASQERPTPSRRPEAQGSSAKPDQGPRRRSFKESRELEALDRELPELEQRKAALESALSTAGSDDLTRLSEELAAVHQQLEQTEERWLELSELAP